MKLTWIAFKRSIVFVAVLVVFFLWAHSAFAAKVKVSWTAPTLRTDGTPLTNLAGYRVEWGSCKADGSFGVYQAGINVNATATSTWIYPTGINPVCARLYSIDSNNVLSNPAYASGPVKTPLSQPTH